MKTNNRTFLYLKNILKMTGASRIRLFLTSLGIFISVCGFAIALMLSDSYFESKRDGYTSADGTAVVIMNTENSDEKIKQLAEKSQATVRRDSVLGSVNVLTSNLKEDKTIKVTATLHGVETTDVILQLDNSQYVPLNPCVVSGRGITGNDVREYSPVVVIDEYTASLLFGNEEEAVGKSLVIAQSLNEIGESGLQYEFTVAGIMENSRLTEHKAVENQKKILNGNGTINISVDIYCPVSTLCQYWQEGNVTIEYILNFTSSEGADNYAAELNELIAGSGNMYGNNKVITKSGLLENIDEQMQETEKLITICIIALAFVFGISITSVVFFSVKERIPEIGIRKAFGAGGTDIVFQIFGEMTIISLIASVLGVLAALYCSKLFEYYMVSRLYTYFKLYISARDIVLPVLTGILESVIFGIIPGIYGASINVTDALKFE